jgi:hypothetical protein
MSTESRFTRFLNNTRLNDAQLEEARQRTEAVAKKLHERLYPNTSYAGSTKMLIGSHGKKTRVKPPRDIDVLFLMPNAEYSRYDNYSGNGQSALLQNVRSILAERYPNTDIRGDRQVVVVSFGSGHAVEVLPAWKATTGKYLTADSKGGGRWRVSDYKAEVANLDQSDLASNKNTRKLIRMMKLWQWYCSVPIKSLALELRAVNFMSTWGHKTEGAHYHDWMVRDFLGELVKRPNYQSKIPGIDEKCQYGDAWLSRAESAYNRAVKACENEAEDKEILAVAQWQKIFGTMYA